MKLCSLALGTLFCVGLVAAPAHAQRARDPLLLSDKPAPRSECRVARDPSKLPSVGELTDSAALSGALAEFAREYPVRDGKLFGLYSVAFDKDGRVERVAPIDYWLPQGMEPDFTSMVRRSVRSQRGGKPWSVRVRVEPGAEAPVRVGRSEVCPARSNTRFSVTAPAFYPVRAPSPMRFRVMVGTQGQIGSLQLVRSSGSGEMDRWVEETFVRHSFIPGLIDGVPVAMEVDEEVQIRARP